MDEDEYEVAKRRLQEFKKKIGIVSDKSDGDEKVVNNPDCSMFNPVRESLMGLAGYLCINCHAKHTPGSCQPVA